MNLFDTHCHLTDERFQGDFDQVLERMKEAAVSFAVVVGEASDETDAPDALKLCEVHAHFYAAVGRRPPPP